MKLTITVCAYNRPEYLRRVLNSLVVAREHCPKFDAKVYIGLDPGGDRQEDVMDVAMSFRFSQTIIVWPEHHGVSNAPRQLLQHVFTEGESDFNLHLEDDTVLSPDALRLCLWFSKEPVGILSLHSKSTDLTDDSRRVICRPDFGVWGWATHSSYWHHLISRYWNHRITPPTGWDYSLTETLQRKNKIVVCPSISRVHNIGREGGAHQTPEGYDEEMKGLVYAGHGQMVAVDDFYYSL